MQPWWACGTWTFVKSRLKPKSTVFEWGSGGSTICLAKICQVISVENDLKWFNKLKKQLNKNKNKNVTLLYWLETEKSDNDPSDPEGFASGSKFYNQIDFERYVRSIEPYEEFDLIIVDGRARPSCVHYAIDKVKSGGILLLDDCWRPRYQKAIDEIPKTWKRHRFLSKNDVHTTSIWIKP